MCDIPTKTLRKTPCKKTPNIKNNFKSCNIILQSLNSRYNLRKTDY